MQQITGLSPMPREMLYTRVADEIRRYIAENRLQEGDRLPAERALAKALGVSRNSVREALRILELRGIITVKTGRGTFVNICAEGPAMFISIVRIDFLEMLEVKFALEALAIRQAIGVIQPRDYDELEGLARQMMENYRRGEYDEALDIRFHKRLMSFVPNISLGHMICEVIDVFTGYWQQISSNERFKDPVAITLDTIPYHLDMILAMRKGDIEEAVKTHRSIYDTDVKALNRIQQ